MGISKQADKSEAKLDEFALELRDRAIAEARRGPLKLSDSADVLRAHIKGLVDRDAPGLAASTRDELVDRVAIAPLSIWARQTIENRGLRNFKVWLPAGPIWQLVLWHCVAAFAS